MTSAPVILASATCHQFPFDGLKLDRSFVHRLETDDQSQTIICTLVQLAENLNMQVVAEGIETIPQLEFLRQLNCQMGQGYYFFPPHECDRRGAVYCPAGWPRDMEYL